MAEPSNRAAMLLKRDILRQIVEEKYRSGRTSLTPLDDNFMMIYFGILFRATSPFLEIFNEILGRMESSGFIIHSDESYSSRKIKDIGPQVLTLDHLKVAFFICHVPLIVSAVAFFVELVASRWFFRKIRNIILRKRRRAVAQKYFTRIADRSLVRGKSLGKQSGLKKNRC